MFLEARHHSLLSFHPAPIADAMNILLRNPLMTKVVADDSSKASITINHTSIVNHDYYSSNRYQQLSAAILVIMIISCSILASSTGSAAQVSSLQFHSDAARASN